MKTTTEAISTKYKNSLVELDKFGSVSIENEIKERIIKICIVQSKETPNFESDASTTLLTFSRILST